MNKVLKDIINRFHVLMGRRVKCVPGSTGPIPSA